MLCHLYIGKDNMSAVKVIRVLVVDDSSVFRELLSNKISLDRRIEVVGVAADPFEARDKILDLVPDVITLDLELPKMNGIEFLRRLMPQYPLPTVVVSNHHEAILDALEVGAVDFIQKPLEHRGCLLDTFIQKLIVKIKIASMSNVSNYKSDYVHMIAAAGQKVHQEKIIAIGASTGGTEAIFEIIKALPKNMPGIVVVQHMPESFTKMYANRLNSTCPMEAREAEDQSPVLPGRVLIAPGGCHTKLVKQNGRYCVRCFQADKVNGHMPSVDVLFDSVAKEAGANAIGVILTGMGQDGAKGLLEMRRKGAVTLGQDPASCVVYGMPKIAFDIGGVSQQLPLDAIAKKLFTLVKS